MASRRLYHVAHTTLAALKIRRIVRILPLSDKARVAERPVRPYNAPPMSKQNKSPANSGTIALNKKAKHEYFVEERYEAGVALTGWEVKSLRAGKVQLVDSYVLLKNNEAFLFGALITPLQTVSTHVVADPTRTRKLLLKARELDKIIAAVQQKGFSCVPMALYWKGHLVKCEIALVRGKKDFDKRQVEKERDWVREKARVVRDNHR